MADKTSIEWTDSTWNPIRARNKATGRQGHFCEKVSPGCKNCYAEKMNGWRGNRVPYAIDKRDQVELYLDRETISDPLRWRKPRNVFPCSMTDLFADFVPDEWIDLMFVVMAASMKKGHTFQVLTKRAQRMHDWFAKRTPEFWDRIFMDIPGVCSVSGGLLAKNWPLPNVWLGVSVDDQQRADERVPLLLQTPARVRWVSAEPLLGPVDLSAWLDPTGLCCGPEPEYSRSCDGCPHHKEVYDEAGVVTLDWVVAGGESGAGARPANPDWFRRLRDDCDLANVPFFFKQWGCWVPSFPGSKRDAMVGSEGHVLNFPFKGSDATNRTYDRMTRVSKKQGGRILDGRTHDGYPAACNAEVSA